MKLFIELIIILITIAFFAFLIYIIYKKYNNLTNSVIELTSILKTQQFSNIETIEDNPNITLIKADSKGENFLFGVKQNSQFISVNDIEYTNNYAQQNHIHHCIIAINPNLIPEAGLLRIQNYNIEIWDQEKLDSLSKPASKQHSSPDTNILQTSDTSDDKCEIDTESFDPIQDGEQKLNSIFDGINDKPDEL